MVEDKGNWAVHSYPTARKVYTCAWCGEKIWKNNVYFKYRGRWKGEWEEYRMHSECQEELERSCQTEFVEGENARPTKTNVIIVGEDGQREFDFQSSHHHHSHSQINEFMGDRSPEFMGGSGSGGSSFENGTPYEGDQGHGHGCEW